MIYEEFTEITVNLSRLSINICSHTYTNINSFYQRKVPLTLTLVIRSYFFIGVSAVPVKWIALALFIKISMPPNVFTAAATAFCTSSSIRTSIVNGRHLPPAASTNKNYQFMIKTSNSAVTQWLNNTVKIHEYLQIYHQGS